MTAHSQDRSVPKPSFNIKGAGRKPKSPLDKKQQQWTYLPTADVVDATRYATSNGYETLGQYIAYAVEQQMIRDGIKQVAQ